MSVLCILALLKCLGTGLSGLSVEMSFSAVSNRGRFKFRFRFKVNWENAEASGIQAHDHYFYKNLKQKICHISRYYTPKICV